MKQEVGNDEIRGMKGFYARIPGGVNEKRLHKLCMSKILF